MNYTSVRITYYLKYCLVKRCVNPLALLFSSRACHIIINYVTYNYAEPPPTSTYEATPPHCNQTDNV